MAIIFADVVPEINKLYDYMQQCKKTDVSYGRTTYKFTPVDGTVRPELMIVQRRPVWSRDAKPSKLYLGYCNIVSKNRNSETLTRHEKSIIRAFYKYVYGRFDTTVAALSTNTQSLTKLQGELTKIENQLNMLKAIKNAEKLTPRYVKLFGLIIPLVNSPVDIYKEIDAEVKNARGDLENRLRQVGNAINKYKKETLAENIKMTVNSLNNKLPKISASIKKLMDKPPAWVTHTAYHETLPYGAFEDCDIDKVLGTQDGRYHKMLMRNGKNLRYATWCKTFITNNFNDVLFFNGIDTYLEHAAYTPEDYAKIAKIAQIFGVIMMVEQDVAKDTVEHTDGYTFNLKEHFEKVRNKLKEIGYDPDVSIL